MCSVRKAISFQTLDKKMQNSHSVYSCCPFTLLQKQISLVWNSASPNTACGSQSGKCLLWSYFLVRCQNNFKISSWAYELQHLAVFNNTHSCRTSPVFKRYEQSWGMSTLTGILEISYGIKVENPSEEHWPRKQSVKSVIRMASVGLPD